jgi:hypothetical protein
MFFINVSHIRFVSKILKGDQVKAEVADVKRASDLLLFLFSTQEANAIKMFTTRFYLAGPKFMLCVSAFSKVDVDLHRNVV